MLLIIGNNSNNNNRHYNITLTITKITIITSYRSVPGTSSTYIHIYIYTYIYTYIAFWQSSAPVALSTLVTSVVLYSCDPSHTDESWEG